MIPPETCLLAKNGRTAHDARRTGARVGSLLWVLWSGRSDYRSILLTKLFECDDFDFCGVKK